MSIRKIQAGRLAVVAVVAVLATTPSVEAVVFRLSVDGVVIGHAVNRDDNRLYEINLNTGQATDKGSVGFFDVRAVTYDSNGVLWGVDAATDQLIQINPDTGVANVVGGLNLDINELVGMTFDRGIQTESPDGSLLLSNWTPVTPNDPDTLWNAALYTLNPFTGHATHLVDLADQLIDRLEFLEPTFTDIASVNPLFGGWAFTFNIDPTSGTVKGSFGNFPDEFPDLFEPDIGANIGLAPTSDGFVMGIEDQFNTTFVGIDGSFFSISNVELGRFDNLAIAPGQEISATLVVVPAPEPVTAMLGLMGLSALGAVARRWAA